MGGIWLNKESSRILKIGEKHLKVWAYGAKIIAFWLCLSNPPQIEFESRVMGDYPARFDNYFEYTLVNWSPPMWIGAPLTPTPSNKKEATLSTAESPLILFYYDKSVCQPEILFWFDRSTYDTHLWLSSR